MALLSYWWLWSWSGLLSICGSWPSQWRHPEENYKSILAAENMVYAIERQDSAILLLFAGYEEQGWKQFRENESEFFQWLARAKDNITVEGEGTIVKNIETGYSSYLQHVVELKSISIGSPRKTATFYHEPFSFFSLSPWHLHSPERDQPGEYVQGERPSTLYCKEGYLVYGHHRDCGCGDGIGFSLLLSNLLTKPVRQMVDATQKIERGIMTFKSRSIPLMNWVTWQKSLIRWPKNWRDFMIWISNKLWQKSKKVKPLSEALTWYYLVDAEFKVTGMNPMARRILNMQPDEPQNRHFLEVVKSEPLFQYIHQSMESGKPPNIEEKPKYLSR